MSTLKESFYKNNGLSINTLTEGIVTDTEKVSLQKAIKLLSSYAESETAEYSEYEFKRENPYVKMIADIVKDLQSLEQKI